MFVWIPERVGRRPGAGGRKEEAEVTSAHRLSRESQEKTGP